jgi:hypothetical protein
MIVQHIPPSSAADWATDLSDVEDFLHNRHHQFDVG